MLARSWPSEYPQTIAIMGEDKYPKVSCEDAKLFRESVGEIRHVRDERVERPHSRPQPRPQRRGPDSAPPTKASAQGLSTEEPVVEDTRGESLSFMRSGVQTRVLRRLKRGQIPLDETLDLHGLTADEASVRLGEFLHYAHQRGQRALLIVHGKGQGSGRGGPRLKTLLNRWLRLRAEVIAFCTAQPRHGGTGALYVLLHRARDQ